MSQIFRKNNFLEIGLEEQNMTKSHFSQYTIFTGQCEGSPTPYLMRQPTSHDGFEKANMQANTITQFMTSSYFFNQACMFFQSCVLFGFMQSRFNCAGTDRPNFTLSFVCRAVFRESMSLAW